MSDANEPDVSEPLSDGELSLVKMIIATAQSTLRDPTTTYWLPRLVRTIERDRQKLTAREEEVAQLQASVLELAAENKRLRTGN